MLFVTFIMIKGVCGDLWELWKRPTLGASIQLFPPGAGKGFQDMQRV